MTIDLVILDLDGVLLNTAELKEQAEQSAFREAGLVLSLTDIHRRFSWPDRHQHATFCRNEFSRRTGRPLPENFFARRREIYADLENRRLGLQPDIMNMLQSFGRAGLKSCIATNNDRLSMERKLRGTALEPFFAGRIFTRDFVRKTKPAPDIYHYAARAMDVPPQNCLAVEDTPKGVLAAVGAGMTVFGLSARINRDKRDSEKLRQAGAVHVAFSVKALENAIFRRLPEKPGPRAALAPEANLNPPANAL